MKQAACTIVSLNYLPYARALCSSFLCHHPGWKFYVLLVDRLTPNIDLSSEQFDLVLVEDLDIPDFPSIAFKYDILELNTNVKPTFLKALFRLGYERVIYLDPDIFVYRPLSPVLSALNDHSIAIIPHALSPDDEVVQNEVIFLLGGVFNLGFIGLSASEESRTFLDWWEARCLNYAFNEPKKGMFVDQKWINLVPCFFQSVAIVKHLGCNMAYWNLHERLLTRESGVWVVNGSSPLIFFHFSGITVDESQKVSKYSKRFTLANRPDLRVIHEDYRNELVARGIREFSAKQYGFGAFDNGELINKLARSLYAAKQAEFAAENPFQSKSRFYAWAKKRRLLSRQESAKYFSSESLAKPDVRLRVMRFLFRFLLRIVGADRYTVLMKYLSYVSILRNQGDVFLE